MVDRQARDLEVQSSNTGPGLNFALEINKKIDTGGTCTTCFEPDHFHGPARLDVRWSDS